MDFVIKPILVFGQCRFVRPCHFSSVKTTKSNDRGPIAIGASPINTSVCYSDTVVRIGESCRGGNSRNTWLRSWSASRRWSRPGAMGLQAGTLLQPLNNLFAEASICDSGGAARTVRQACRIYSFGEFLYALLAADEALLGQMDTRSACDEVKLGQSGRFVCRPV
jgi:hypothetical protein